MHRLAWHAAHIMNIHLKKKVTVKKLLGKEKSMTPLEREKEWLKLKEALKERSNNLAHNNRKPTHKSWGPIQGRQKGF